MKTQFLSLLFGVVTMFSCKKNDSMLLVSDNNNNTDIGQNQPGPLVVGRAVLNFAVSPNVFDQSIHPVAEVSNWASSEMLSGKRQIQLKNQLKAGEIIRNSVLVIDLPSNASQNQSFSMDNSNPTFAAKLIVSEKIKESVPYVEYTSVSGNVQIITISNSEVSGRFNGEVRDANGNKMQINDGMFEARF